MLDSLPIPKKYVEQLDKELEKRMGGKLKDLFNYEGLADGIKKSLGSADMKDMLALSLMSGSGGGSTKSKLNSSLVDIDIKSISADPEFLDGLAEGIVSELASALDESEMTDLLEGILAVDKQELKETAKQNKKLTEMNEFISRLGGKSALGGIGKLLAGGGAVAGAMKGAKGLAGFALKRLGPMAMAFDMLQGYFDPSLAGNKAASRMGAHLITGGEDGSRAGNALKGAAAGAMLGSIVPVIGTTVGAVVGGIAGYAASYLDTKWVAEQFDKLIDGVMWLFDPKTWFGSNGLIQKGKEIAVAFGAKVGGLVSNLIEWGGNMVSDIWRIIRTPFTAEFWQSGFAAIGDKKEELAEAIHLYAKEAYEKGNEILGTIWEWISRPFSKDFWYNGTDGVLDRIGDIGEIFSNAIAERWEEVKGSIVGWFKGEKEPASAVSPEGMILNRMDAESARLRTAPMESYINNQSQDDYQRHQRDMLRHPSTAAIMNNQTVNSGNQNNQTVVMPTISDSSIDRINNRAIGFY